MVINDILTYVLWYLVTTIVVTTVDISLPTACTRNPSRKMFGCCRFKGACQDLGISSDKVHTNWYTDFIVDECLFFSGFI